MGYFPRVSTVLGILTRSEKADPLQVGGFKPQDKITRASDPTATSSLPSQAQERTRPLPTTGPKYSHASFAVKSEGSQGSVTELDSESLAGGGGTRRSSQKHDKNVAEYRNIEKQAGFKSGNGRKRRPARPVGEVIGNFKRKSHLISQGRAVKELVHDQIDDDDELAGDDGDIRQFRRAKRNSGPVDLTMDDSPKQNKSQHKPIAQAFIDFTIVTHDETPGKRLRNDEEDELNDEKAQRETKKARLQQKNTTTKPSQDVVSRADIKPTKFSSSHATDNKLPSLGPLILLQAFRGPHYFCKDKQVLKLETGASGPVFHAYQQDGTEWSPHSDWLVVNVAQLNKVVWNTRSCQIALDLRGGTSSGGKALTPRLFLEFSGHDDIERLVSWLKDHRGSKTDIKFEESDLDSLKKIFDHQCHEIQAAINQRMQRKPAEAEDVQLLKHNQKLRGVTNGEESRCQPDRLSQAHRRPKLVDGLIAQTKPAMIELEGEKRTNEITAQPSQRALRSRQTSKNTFDLTQSFEPTSRSPSPKPKPKLWTQENPGWDKEWRVDLSQFRTTIHKGDIGRLEQGELLNDSIISFYLQYLHEAVRNKDAEIAKRFYFQSSFFWDQLKSTPNKKGINYEKVKSWTNRVDLFSYDYIVVPVNENSHWYVAVICNPGKLLPADEKCQDASTPNDPLREARASADAIGVSESGRITNGSSPEEVPVAASSHLSPGTEMSNNLGRLSLGKPVQGKSDGTTAISIDDDEDVGPSSSRQASAPKDGVDDDICLVTSDLEPHRKPNKTNGKGSDVKSKDSPVITGKDPCIITFDSLGSSHSPVCTALKKYLEHEAKHRKGLDIEMPNMGRTAKNIPLQDNYWDCGVFLMSYVEALMRNPEEFIRKVLPRKAGAADEELACTVDAAAMRKLIRTTILKQQVIYQKKVEDEAEAKRLRKLRKAQKSASAGASSPPAPPLSSQVTTPSSPAPVPSSLPAQSEKPLPSIEIPSASSRADESSAR
ncbi:hypothetical protein PpBr36_01924 [Pyricularia pennisetigena]|uniref:hypothetical protein n=1 Tax=Pyricularia pennisetigena TaxID=1578925 RepID=UPI00114F64FB|nr:hypothetical protein PpBr36_01924 [Pyricularia pennisetigena]TLS28370.1 hypothetical protein PpBr36_01924 [Pyricularia pennisetigena]